MTPAARGHPGRDDLAELLHGDVLEVAPRLLGAVLVHERPEGRVAVRLTEVEAYGGPDDPGSHAHRGPTRRNHTMFDAAGGLYVYFTYGLHHCANVVVGPPGTPGAVLLRAGEVVDGTPLAARRRGPRPWPDRDLARGPARLCQALGVDLSHDGTDLANGPLRLVPSREPVDPDVVRRGPRVGLRRAAERPWRFWLATERTVSSYRPASITNRPTSA